MANCSGVNKPCLLCAINPVYCVLCSLALWLELNLKSNPVAMSSPYVFCISDNIRMPDGGLKSKAMIQNALKIMFKGEQFKCAEEEDAASMLLGSHSVRKYAATYARRCGVTKEEKDIRGRWKGQGRVSDIYDDVELSYPDAKVAEKLCGASEVEKRSFYNIYEFPYFLYMILEIEIY